MAFISTEEINDLKSQVNIVDLISQYVALTRAGKNYLGLCPFHGEKTPSFNVNAEKSFYHCFGCGKSGDAIEFLKEYKQIGFSDALQELAKFAGVTLNIEKNQEEQKENPNTQLYEVNNQAARLYNILLMSTELGAKALEYLENRGISSEIIKHYNIGLAPDEDDFIYKNLSSKFTDDVLANVGLFNFSNNKVFDAFQNRIMFPITNEYGHTIGFSGRVWQEGDNAKGKYINTTTTAIFDKSFELYNFDKAKSTISKKREVYLMEGFMDVIAAYKAGITNVVATMGTALTDKHIRRLGKMVNQFVLVYDGDKAGQNAIYKAIELAGSERTQIVQIPEGLDPDEYSKKYSLEELSNLMTNGRIQPIEFFISYLAPENLANTQNQLNFIEQMAPLIAKEKSLTAQDLYIRKLVEILPDFEYNQVEEAVNRKRENQVQSGESNDNFIAFEEELYTPDEYFQPSPYLAQPSDKREITIESPVQRSRGEVSESQLLQRMIEHSEVLQRFAEDENFRFVHKQYQDLFDKVLMDYMTFGSVDGSRLLRELTDEEKSLYYQILNIDLPKEFTKDEISDLLANFSQEMEEVKLNELQQQLETAKKSNNKERELELTIQIISLKKKLS
ncbi:MAG: DNA primase [Streptococcaceae bacterium]|nr:DNA primase [Streptococcaceae bacterium]MCL2681403.1 DNA primase [Streptococcaceae bacterium]